MTAVIDVQLQGDDVVARRLATLAGAHLDAARAVLRPLGETYLSQLRADTPEGQGENPGRLRAGYQTQEFYSATQASYRITNEVPHLRFVLRGRGPIVAARGRALRFVIRGQVFYRKRVKAAPANNYPARTRRVMQGRLDRLGPEIAGAMVRSYQGGA